MTINSNLNTAEELIDSHLSKLVMDAKFEDFLNTITNLTSKICLAPIALITFVNDESIWIQSEGGISTAKISPNKKQFCGIFPKNKDYFEISDTNEDIVHKAHSFLIKGEKAKFYAGAKIKVPAGSNLIGVLCVFDTAPRTLIGLQREYLLGMAEVIEKALITKNFVRSV